MEFDKKIFKQHYGKKYFDALKYSFCVFATAVILFIVLKITNMPELIQLQKIIGIIILIYIVPIEPVICSVYITKKDKAKLQKQYFIKDTLVVVSFFETGIAGVNINRWKHYYVSDIKEVIITDRYICIDGNILMEDYDLGTIQRMQVSSVKVPRVFTNENLIVDRGESQ